MKVVVTDANIFFDLIQIGALVQFFQLKVEFHTTALVMDECDPRDISILQPYLDSKELFVRSFNDKEMSVVQQTGKRKGLRVADRSVLLHALGITGIVLSGDSDMRKECAEMLLGCHGILWCISELNKQGLLTTTECLALLDKLEGVNKWLPKKEMGQLREDLTDGLHS